MPISGYFDVPFAVGGDLTAVPDGTQIDGSVSYENGYAILYSTPVGSGGFDFPRRQHNQILNDITTAIQKLQQGTPTPFITSAMNGGSPYSYPFGATVSLGGVNYTSLVGSNTDTPPTSKWAIAFGAQSGSFTAGHMAVFADTYGTIEDGGAPLSGTVTSITAGTGLTGGVITTSGTIALGIATTSVRGGVIPDGTIITVDGTGHITVPVGSSGAKGVVEVDNTTITAASGVISAATATGSVKGISKPDGTTISISGGVISVITSNSLGTNGWRKNSDGTIEQWGTVAANQAASVTQTITFPLTFPNNIWNVVNTWIVNNAGGAPDGSWSAILGSGSPSAPTWTTSQVQFVDTASRSWRAFGD